MKTDSKIKQDVQDELAWQPGIDESKIGVTVDKGVVTLSGSVDSYTKKMAAEKAAKSVHGVKAVAEDIEVVYGTSFRKNDTDIAKAAVNALKWNMTVPDDKIMIKVEDGWVYLTGELTWEYQKNAAKNALQHLTGVRGVANNITLKSTIVPTDIKSRITKAFERTADFDANHIKVEVFGHTVKLTGTVRSIKEKNDARWAAYNAPGVTEVKNELKVQYYTEYA
ncbi:Osmotically-inducible protein OsmY, contains BON domain [Pricia antarctica]|uniref:Osmotically-inducible protein OsmY, contains BON domain n=1 Tax=Pricia antarctica TaxID=641691 RepID=A0A1G7CWI3_9FLAO|nr:BON domain-containing protein [Pricia antarctica]SDE43140.1 Osmotically-inducible protein OsmY, contains BON domain [Pricia antarctica]